MDKKSTDTEYYELEGIVYLIEINKEKNYFYGSWLCPVCGKRGSSSKACKDFDEALSFAKLNLSTHKTSHKKA